MYKMRTTTIQPVNSRIPVVAVEEADIEYADNGQGWSYGHAIFPSYFTKGSLSDNVSSDRGEQRRAPVWMANNINVLQMNGRILIKMEWAYIDCKNQQNSITQPQTKGNGQR